jgi:hypothetical protein
MVILSQMSSQNPASFKKRFSVMALGVLVATSFMASSMQEAAAVPFSAGSSSLPQFETQTETVAHRRHHRKKRVVRNSGALLAGALALGAIGAIAASSSANAYERHDGYAPNYYPDQGYQQVQYYNNNQHYGAYEQPYHSGGTVYYEQQYSQPAYGYRQRGHGQHAYGYGGGYQQPYYDKEAAKAYWKEQKRVQKKAIKNGYYNNPYGQHGGQYGQGGYYGR